MKFPFAALSSLVLVAIATGASLVFLGIDAGLRQANNVVASPPGGGGLSLTTRTNRKLQDGLGLEMKSCAKFYRQRLDNVHGMLKKKSDEEMANYICKPAKRKQLKEKLKNLRATINADASEVCEGGCEGCSHQCQLRFNLFLLEGKASIEKALRSTSACKKGVKKEVAKYRLFVEGQSGGRSLLMKYAKSLSEAIKSAQQSSEPNVKKYHKINVHLKRWKTLYDGDGADDDLYFINKKGYRDIEEKVYKKYDKSYHHCSDLSYTERCRKDKMPEKAQKDLKNAEGMLKNLKETEDLDDDDSVSSSLDIKRHGEKQSISKAEHEDKTKLKDIGVGCGNHGVKASGYNTCQDPKEIQMKSLQQNIQHKRNGKLVYSDDDDYVDCHASAMQQAKNDLVKVENLDAEGEGSKSEIKKYGDNHVKETEDAGVDKMYMKEQAKEWGSRDSLDDDLASYDEAEAEAADQPDDDFFSVPTCTTQWCLDHAKGLDIAMDVFKWVLVFACS